VSEAILDASALMALIRSEPGAPIVLQVVTIGAAISTVNLSETVSRLSDLGRSEENIRQEIERVGLEVIPFDEDQAYRAGVLRIATRAAGLSFGDRACVALAQQLGVPALTADRSWQSLNINGVEVRLIR